MATIKDVAQHAQVSITTVSHVLNGTRGVATETRARVMKAIEELRYVPSATARSLKTQRSGIIGMVLPNNSNPFFAEVIRGVEDVCYEHGYNLILCNTDDSPQKQGRVVRVLTERQVDGIVVLSSGDDANLYALLDEAGLPHVIVDRETGKTGSDLVQVDHELGGKLATSHLLAMGHRRIACISGPLSLSPVRHRLRGYQKALEEAGINPRDCAQLESDFTSAGGFSSMMQLLTLHPRPTAVFACNDLMAIGAICAIASVGLKVPEDISVVGFDDVALAEYTNPPLTTVAQPMGTIGEVAASMLIDRIATPAMKPRREKLSPRLVIRKSTTVQRGPSEPLHATERGPRKRAAVRS